MRSRALRTVEENALLIAQHIREPVRLAEAEVIQDTFLPELEEDPRQVSMDEKLELTRRYNNLPLGHEGIATTITGYSEVIREKYFLNTEGTEDPGGSGYDPAFLLDYEQGWKPDPECPAGTGRKPGIFESEKPGG